MRFICMAVQGEPVEETVLTDVIRSAVSNITNTIDKELKIIENSFFPKYVVKEIYKLIAETAFPDDELERRTKVAKITLQMLKNVFGKGIIVNSQDQPLFTRDYEVQVSKSPTFGKMHENAIVDIKINADFILITRANAFGLNANFNGGKTAISSCEVHNYTSKYFDDYDVFALTPFTDYSSHPVRIPGKRDRLLHFKCCSCLSFCCKVQAAVITSVPKGSLIDAVPQHSVSIALENERQMQNIRKLRMAVRAEIAAIRESKKTTTTTTILATTITPTTDVLLNEINDTTPQPIIVLENEKQLKFLQDIREVLKLELNAAAVKNSGSSSVSELISFVILINFWITVFSNTL